MVFWLVCMWQSEVLSIWLICFCWLSSCNKFSWNGQLVLWLWYHPWYEISKCCVLVLMTVSCYLKCQSTHKTKLDNVTYIITLSCWQYPPNCLMLNTSLPNVAFAGWLQKVSCAPILPFVVCWILHIELLICCGLWHVVTSCWNGLFLLCICRVSVPILCAIVAMPPRLSMVGLVYTKGF